MHLLDLVALLALVQPASDLSDEELLARLQAQQSGPWEAYGEQIVPGPEWAHVTFDGWTYAFESADGDVIQFVQPGRSRGHVWARYEYLEMTAARPFRSLRVLYEINCSTWQTRTVQMDAFAQSNFSGDQLFVPFTQQWEYAAPTTFSEAVLDYGCGD